MYNVYDINDYIQSIVGKQLISIMDIICIMIK